MRNTFYFQSIFPVFVVVCFNFSGIAQSDLQIPSADSNVLFYLQRTPDLNTVVYELNIKNKVLDEKKPVRAYWIRYAENGQREELSLIQRKYAYGIITDKLSDNHYTLSLVSYKKYIMFLEPGPNDRLHVFVYINRIRVILSNIYIKINGGSFWSPNIEFIELSGIDPANGALVKERIKI